MKKQTFSFSGDYKRMKTIYFCQQMPLYPAHWIFKDENINIGSVNQFEPMTNVIAEGSHNIG